MKASVLVYSAKAMWLVHKRLRTRMKKAILKWSVLNDQATLKAFMEGFQIGYAGGATAAMVFVKPDAFPEETRQIANEIRGQVELVEELAQAEGIQIDELSLPKSSAEAAFDDRSNYLTDLKQKLPRGSWFDDGCTCASCCRRRAEANGTAGKVDDDQDVKGFRADLNSLVKELAKKHNLEIGDIEMLAVPQG